MNQYKVDLVCWKQCLECGNRCFSEGNNLLAYDNFQDAVARAYRLFCEYPIEQGVVNALLVSHYNLAYLHVKDQALDLAYQELATVNKYIEDALESYESCSTELPHSLLWGKNISLKQLLLFEQSYCN